MAKNPRKGFVCAMRSKISEAVVKIIAKDSPDIITMEMVANELGISRANIYNYFKDVDDLLTYTVSHALATYTKIGWETADACASLDNKLRTVVEVLLTFSEKTKGLYGIIIKNLSARAMKKVEKLRAGNFKRLEKIMAYGQENNLLRGFDTRDMAMFFHGLVRGVIVIRQGTAQTARRTITQDAETVVKRFLRGAGWRNPECLN